MVTRIRAPVGFGDALQVDQQKQCAQSDSAGHSKGWSKPSRPITKGEGVRSQIAMNTVQIAEAKRPHHRMGDRLLGTQWGRAGGWSMNETSIGSLTHTY